MFDSKSAQNSAQPTSTAFAFSATEDQKDQYYYLHNNNIDLFGPFSNGKYGFIVNVVFSLKMRMQKDL